MGQPFCVESPSTAGRKQRATPLNALTVSIRRVWLEAL